MDHKRSLMFLLVMFSVALLDAVAPGASAYAQEVAGGPGIMGGGDKALMAIAAMGAVGLSCISSGYALARIGSAALGAMSEKPEIGGRALVFLGMAEGIAIYGLIIAIMMLNKI